MALSVHPHRHGRLTPNLPTNIVDFRGFDSSIILIQRGGILPESLIYMSIGNFPESLSQAMLVGVMLVGGLGVCTISLLAIMLCIVISCLTCHLDVIVYYCIFV